MVLPVEHRKGDAVSPESITGNEPTPNLREGESPTGDIVEGALRELFGPPTNASARRVWARGVSDICESLVSMSLDGEAVVREIQRRFRVGRDRYTVPLTVDLFAKNWDVLVPGPEKLTFIERPAEPEFQALAPEEARRLAAELAGRYGEAAA
jgi:hypothetical protein